MQLSFHALAQVQEGLVPALDHSLLPNLEDEGAIALVARIKLFAFIIRKLSSVVDRNFITDYRLGATQFSQFTRLDHNLEVAVLMECLIASWYFARLCLSCHKHDPACDDGENFIHFLTLQFKN